MVVLAHSEGALLLEAGVSVVAGCWEGEVRVAVWVVVLARVAWVSQVWKYARGEQLQEELPVH